MNEGWAFPDKTRQEIRQLSSESINPNDYIGREVLFTYHFQFELDKTDSTDIHYSFSNPIHIPLKIVGIYDPSIGFKTVGDVWLPLSLKESLVGLDSNSSLSDMGRLVSRKDPAIY